MQSFSFLARVPEPFDFGLTVKKPAGWHWSVPTEVFEDGKLFTALRLRDFTPVGLKLEETKNGMVKTTVYSGRKISQKQKKETAERVRLGLGVEDDLNGFYSLGNNDTLVKILSEDLRGMRLGFPNDVFERSLLATCLQMAPMKRSTQMMDCLIRSFGEPVAVEKKKIRYWPSPEKIAVADSARLKEECNLGYRAEFIKRTAEAIVKGFPDVLELEGMPEEDALKRLRTLHGIGYYSSQIVSPHHGFPLDVWSARIFHEIMFGKTPDRPRDVIRDVEKEAQKRWGGYMWHVFVYVLNDLERLAKRYRITKLT